MSVLSPNHYGRHLEGDEERADFYRTAPIATPGYWDLADEVGRKDARPEEIQTRHQAVVETLQGRAITGRDDARVRTAANTMDRVIQEAIREY